MNKEKIIVFFIIIGVSLIVFFQLGFNASNNMQKNICFEENRILEKQYLDIYTLYDKDKGVTYNSHDLALFMDFKNDTRLYFIEENKVRVDLKNNELTKVKWCYVPKIKEFRVREVSQ